MHGREIGVPRRNLPGKISKISHCTCTVTIQAYLQCQTPQVFNFYVYINRSGYPDALWKLAHISFDYSSLNSFFLLGKAVFLARDKHHLTDLCHLIRHDTPYLFQEYVKESHGRDVRVVLVGGRVIGSMLRCSTDGRMQSNCSLGKHTPESQWWHTDLLWHWLTTDNGEK